MSERRTETTRTISDVRVVPVIRVLAPISEIKHMQTMRLITLFLTTFGGALFGYPSPYFFLGIIMIGLGVVNEYLNVQRVTSRWERYEPQEVNINETVADTAEYK